MTRSHLAALVLAAAAILAFSTAAPADVMTFDGMGLKATATLHASGSPYDGKTVYVGELLLTYGGQQYTGFCVDIYHSAGDMGVDELGLDSLNRPGTFVGEQVAWLVDTYADSLSDGTSAAGLASAIWEVVFEGDGNGLDLAEGDFYLTGNDAVVADAAAKLAGVPDRYQTDTEFTILHSDARQDLLIADHPVPEPAALCLLALGGTMQLVRRRRRS